MKVSLYAQTACTIMVLRWPGARLKAASPSAATMMTKLLLESAGSHGLLTEYLTLLVLDDHRIMLPDTTNVEVIFLRTFFMRPILVTYQAQTSLRRCHIQYGYRAWHLPGSSKGIIWGKGPTDLVVPASSDWPTGYWKTLFPTQWQYQ